MDCFSLCFNAVCLAAQGALHVFFCGRLTGKTPKAGHFAAYVVLLFGLEWLANQVSPPWPAAIGAELLVLWGVNRFALGNGASASWTAAILAVYISQLSFGLVNSVEAVLFPYAVRGPLLYLLVIGAAAVSFGVCAACYAAVARSISPEELGGPAGAGCLLVPALFFFAAELYIMQTSYTQVSDHAPLLEDVGRHGALLVLQALGLGALLCTLYACRQLCRGLRAREEARSLAQAARAQRVYLAEAQARYEQTRAFRHDVKNHLSVLSGLLGGGRLEEGRAYLKSLEGISAALSFPYQTGNPVVDILLGEKLGLAEAEGIGAEVSLCLPAPWGVDDLDLCVIAANALDNAVSACRSVQGERRIRVSGERQGDFYLLVFENSCPDGPLPPPGAGLSNIKAAAEKYRGAMLAEQKDGRFSLSVLLNIS